MGKVVTASCDCGYSADLLLGGGMANFETVCRFPIYCRGCGTLQAANLLESPLTCPGCGGADVVAYDASELLGEAGEGEVFSWHIAEQVGRVLRLSDGRYMCPACRRARLQFGGTGRWD